MKKYKNKTNKRKNRGKKTLKYYKGGNKQVLVILSESNIKIKAAKECFPSSKYELIFVGVPDNPERKQQPLFLEGTQEACSQRINEFYKVYREEIPYDDFMIISIENGILPINSSPSVIQDYNKIEDYKDIIWADFCMIGIVEHVADRKNKKFLISPEIIAIDKIYSEPYFIHHYNKDTELETLGKYISEYARPLYYVEERIAHNNWMKSIAGIDRVTQIKKGLKQI